MVQKFAFLLLAVAAVSVNAAIIAPAAVAVAPAALEQFDPHPQYRYGYDVQDTLSGDSKGHIEERNGDVVRGEYSLVDPDGFRRIVSYTADPVNGFNAVVRREPLVVAAAPAPVAPIVRAAPLVAAAPAPIVRAAPLLAAPTLAIRHL